MNKLINLCCALLLLASCANRGRPDGGPKDEDPPVIISSSPENFSTNFKGNEIRITFDEFIKVKNLQKQLIVSPPLKYDPVIIPQGTASKYIEIQIKDTLPPNTTYAFNFGNSIVDNNEENPFAYYRYVFSTGPTIDSLSVTGVVVDAVQREVDTYVSVMLYEQDSTYTDSIVYKSRPRYITNTLDSLEYFSLDNLKAGSYKMVAIKDVNSNYLFNPKDDKIGFVEGFIEVPKDTIYQIKLFQEDLPFELKRPKQIGATKIEFPYEGVLEPVAIKMLSDSLPEGFEYRILKEPKTDSLHYWYKPKLELDTVQFRAVAHSYVDTLNHRFRSIDVDTMNIKAVTSGLINFDESLTLENNTPFQSIDKSLIEIIDKDSLPVAFEIKLDTLLNRYEFPVALKENESYKVMMLPGAIEDFYGNTTKDTLRYRFSTKSKDDYGNMRMRIVNAELPLVVQLVNERGDVKYEQFARISATVDFNDVIPGEYYVRVIFDVNNNQKWDTGNFLKGTKPERISYFPEVIKFRANFDFEYEFPVLNENGPDPQEN